MPSEPDDGSRSLPDAIDELVTPEVQELIRHRDRWSPSAPVVVPPGDFVPLNEAKRVVRFPDVRRLQAAFVMDVVYCSADGEKGTSRSAFDRELRWRERQTRLDWLRREFRLWFGPAIGF